MSGVFYVLKIPHIMRLAMSFSVLMHCCMPAFALESSDHCQQPTYKGLRSGSILHFEGQTGAAIFSEHGVIDSISPFYRFHFVTTHSNGFSREYITLENMPQIKDVNSVVMRKNSDFTDAAGPAPFIITPDLPVNYYYATNQPGQENMHRFNLDDTWKLIKCDSH